MDVDLLLSRSMNQVPQLQLQMTEPTIINYRESAEKNAAGLRHKTVIMNANFTINHTDNFV